MSLVWKRSASSHKSRSSRWFRPQLERMEERLAPAATLVKDINALPTSSNLVWLTSVNETLFFVADDEIHGVELWKSDGTATGTVLVKDIRPGSYGYFPYSSFPEELTAVNGTLFFRANDGIHGIELWKSDGTEAGTLLVKDIRPGSSYGYPVGSNPGQLTKVQGTLFFTANDGVHGTELWKSDGTPEGTVPIKDINATISGSYANGSFPSYLTAVNGVLFFAADDGVHGVELWKSDGTPEGTLLVKDINSTVDAGVPGSSAPTELTNVNGLLFFVASDGSNGFELWKSDGTPEGTLMVKDIFPGETGANPRQLTNVNGTLFFTATDDVNGFGLWKSDGTEAGTVFLRSLTPTGYPFTTNELTNVNGTLFFVNHEADTGRELWKSDGTPEGTVLVKDIVAGTAGAYPANLTLFQGLLYFQASDPDFGAELWRSDGTAEGTFRVQDIRSGSDSSSPQSLTVRGNQLFFVADDGIHGQELWVFTDSSPTTTGIPDVDVLEDAADTVIDLRQHFDDVEDGPAGLTYTIINVSNPGLFTSTTINSSTDVLTLDYAANAFGDSTITIRATDSSGQFVEATFTVRVAAVNDAPAQPNTFLYLPPIPPNLANPPGRAVAQLLLGANDVDGDPLGIAVVALTGAGTWQYRIGTGPWRNFGPVSAAVARLLRGTDLVRFVPNRNFNGVATITYRAWDQTTGQFGGVVNFTNPANVGGTTAFSVGLRQGIQLINRAPVLRPTPHVFTAILEDRVQPRQQIGTILTGRLSDADPAARRGLAIRNVIGNGTWQFSLNGTTWTNFGDVSDTSALLLRDVDWIRFIPTKDWNGVARIQYRGWDRLVGMQGQKLDLTQMGVGGSWTFSAALAVASLTVRPVNDAPVLPTSQVDLPPLPRSATDPAGIAIALLLEGTTDVDAGALQGIAFLGATGGGTWQYSLNGGATWINFGVVSAAQARLLFATDLVRFVPNGSFTGNATLTYRAWDRTSGTRGTSVNLTAATSVGGSTAFSQEIRTAIQPITE